MTWYIILIKQIYKFNAVLLPLTLPSITIYLYYNLIKALRSSTYILKSEDLNYLQIKFFIVNSNSTSLLNSIINKNHLKMVIVQKKLPFTLPIKVTNRAIVI